MKRTPEEQAAHRKEYVRQKSYEYRQAHPERYALYMLKTTIKKLKTLGIDVRGIVEQLMKEEGL